MSQSHYWLSTDADYQSVVNWLQSEGAEPNGGTFHASVRNEIVVAFPKVGAVTYWPDNIRLSDYPESSARWRSAVLAQNWQKEHPGRKLIDEDFSAITLLQPPYRTPEGIWVGAALHFTGSKLKERFPALYSLCGRFERWLRKRPLVYDNMKRERINPFESNLCPPCIGMKLFAFPEAYHLLQSGECMCSPWATDVAYAKFLRALELQGRRPNKPARSTRYPHGVD